MKALRLVFSLGIVAVASFGFAQAEKWIVTFSGKAVGEGTYEAKPDGSIVSETNAQIMTQKLHTKIVARFDKAKLVEAEIEGNNGGRAATVTFKKEKLWVKVGDKVQQDGIPYKVDGQAYVDPLNPGFMSLGYEKLAQAKSGSEVDIFLLDAFVSFKAKITKRDASAELKSGVVPIEIFSFDFRGTEVQFAFAGGKVVGVNVPSQMFGSHKEGFEGVFADPVLKYKELSPPSFKVKTETKVMSTLSDGTKLACDIARPDADGRYPVILIRTPYGRALSLLQGDWWAKRGYVLVAQDVRGKGDSEGAWDPFNREVEDGKDTLDWLVKQPWCDGNVGMIGGSYLGMVQWSAAVTKHPALKCIVPQVSPPDPTRNIPWDHGAFMLAGAVWWSRIVKDQHADMSVAMTTIANSMGFFKLPISEVDNAMFKQNIPFYDAWLQRPTLDGWKGAFRDDQIGDVQIPTLHISGNWDGDAIGTKLHWAHGRAAGRSNQWMIYGPWEHGFNAKSVFGDQNYGPQAILELDSIYLRFFDTYLKGKSVGWLAQPKVRFFVTGANQWYTGADYPLPYSKPSKVFLAGPSAKGVKGAGRLAGRPSGLPKDSFVYDPNKTKFKGDDITPGATATTMMKPEESGPEDLGYGSTPFDKDTVVTGPFLVELYVSTTAKDATFHAMVVDLHPDGRAQMLGLPGTKRIWFDVLGKPGPIVPNKVYKITLEPWEFAHRFKKGHRIGLIVTSDMFPQFARNPGTGEPDWKASKLLRAVHTVHRTQQYPSSLRFFSFEP